MPITKIDKNHPHRGAVVRTRQQVLVLYLAKSDLSSEVTSWAFFNGLKEEEIDPSLSSPPYEHGSDALLDGWRLIQYPRLEGHGEQAYELDYLPHEFVFEKFPVHSHE